MTFDAWDTVIRELQDKRSQLISARVNVPYDDDGLISDRIADIDIAIDAVRAVWTAEERIGS